MVTHALVSSSFVSTVTICPVLIIKTNGFHVLQEEAGHIAANASESQNALLVGSTSRCSSPHRRRSPHSVLNRIRPHRTPRAGLQASSTPSCAQAAAGYLWHASRGWLAARLLCIVSVCRHLRVLDTAVDHAAVTVSALTSLYTVRLTTPQLGLDSLNNDMLPLPAPALGVFVGSWSAPLATVKEASRLLMSACTAPIELSGADYKAALAAGIAKQSMGYFRSAFYLAGAGYKPGFC